MTHTRLGRQRAQGGLKTPCGVTPPPPVLRKCCFEDCVWLRSTVLSEMQFRDLRFEEDVLVLGFVFFLGGFAVSFRISPLPGGGTCRLHFRFSFLLKIVWHKLCAGFGCQSALWGPTNFVLTRRDCYNGVALEWLSVRNGFPFVMALDGLDSKTWRFWIVPELPFKLTFFYILNLTFTFKLTVKLSFQITLICVSLH